MRARRQQRTFPMSDLKPEPQASPAASILAPVLRGCLKVLLEIIAVLLALTILPFIILIAIMHWAWPWYSSVPTYAKDLNDALITLASVAGVLWSGATIAYSIHRKYTPPLRTGIQLLNFAILAPLAGLIAEGAGLRTAFYFAAWFYIIDTLYSMSNLEMLKPGKFTLKVPAQLPNETPEQARLRQELAAMQLKNIELFKRTAHGTWFFALVAVFSVAIFTTANIFVLAWSCLAVLVISVFLILPEVFRLDDKSDAAT